MVIMYQNFSAKDKNKKQERFHEHYENISEDQKQSLVEYRRNCYIYLNGCPVSFHFLAKRVIGSAAILGQTNSFEKENILNFTFKRWSEKCIFPLFFLI